MTGTSQFYAELCHSLDSSPLLNQSQSADLNALLIKVQTHVLLAESLVDSHKFVEAEFELSRQLNALKVPERTLAKLLLQQESTSGSAAVESQSSVSLNTSPATTSTAATTNDPTPAAPAQNSVYLSTRQDLESLRQVKKNVLVLLISVYDSLGPAKNGLKVQKERWLTEL